MSRAHAHESERGFSLLELLMVVALIGILANIAVPRLMDGMVRAQVAAVLSDADTVFKAAAHYRLENGEYPRSRPWGSRPRELAEWIQDMSFERGALTYRWRRQRTRHGFMVRTTGDRDVLDRIREQWSGASLRFGNRLYLYETH